MAAADPDRAVEPGIVISVGVDFWRCRAWMPGVGECLAFVPLPADGSPPERCWRGHYQPWYGTWEREHRGGTRRGSSGRTGDRASTTAADRGARLHHLPVGGQLAEPRVAEVRVDLGNLDVG